MKFRQVTSTKYVGQDGYQLIKCKTGSFSICKGSTVTKWGTGFNTVKSAENFLKGRDHVKATTETLPIEQKDLDFIGMIYGATFRGRGRQLVSDTFTLIIPDNFKETHTVQLKANAKGDPDKMIDDVQQLLLELDDLTAPVFSSVVYRGTELRSIFAKRDRRTSREIARDLIRVRSSNVWAYGVEIKDNNAKVGDVYVQFKGKNGGPADVYQYMDVPINIWRKVLSSPSKGHAVWKYLRNNFLYRKLTGDKRGKLPNAVN